MPPQQASNWTPSSKKPICEWFCRPAHDVGDVVDVECCDQPARPRAEALRAALPTSDPLGGAAAALPVLHRANSAVVVVVVVVDRNEVAVRSEAAAVDRPKEGPIAACRVPIDGASP